MWPCTRRTHSFRYISRADHFKEHRHAAHSAEFYITWDGSKFDNCDADFEQDPQIQPMGAVLAVRVTSEDANDGFKPTCGVIDELNFRNSPDVWGYFSVKSGGGIHEFSDSQVPLAAYLAVLMCHVSATSPTVSAPFLNQLCSLFIQLLLLLVVDKAVHMPGPP